jgi:hypothetical protein
MAMQVAIQVVVAPLAIGYADRHRKTVELTAAAWAVSTMGVALLAMSTTLPAGKQWLSLPNHDFLNVNSDSDTGDTFGHGTSERDTPQTRHLGGVTFSRVGAMDHVDRLGSTSVCSALAGRYPSVEEE